MSKSNFLRRPEQGFTIVELTIAMGFLAVLMFILLISSFQMINIFNKGVTLKRVDQSGRTIGAEIQTSFRHTDTRQSDAVSVVTGTLGTNTVPIRACTGSYSYIWSIYGQPPNTITQEFDGASPTDTPIGFVKIFDADRSYCSDATKKPPKDESTELLADGLVMRYPVSLASTADGKLTTFTYTISTPDGNDDLIFDDSGRANCKGGHDGSFCALNTFIVTVYSKGI